MAVSFIDDTSNDSSATGSEPTGAAQDDILVGVYRTADATAHSGPAGWTKHEDLTESGSSRHVSVWTIKRGSSAPSYVWSGGTTPGIWVSCYRGADLTNWYQDSDIIQNAVGDPDSPSINGTNGGFLICGAYPFGGSPGVVTQPTGMTKRDTGASVSMHTADVALAATGATGAKTWAFATNRASISWSLSLAPVSSNATGTMAATMTPATASLTGVMQPSGTIASTLQMALMNATGVMQPSGTIAATMTKALMDAAGVMQPSGVLSAAITKMLMDAAGEVPAEGVMAAALQAALFSGSGYMVPSGAIASVFQALIFAGTGEKSVPGEVHGNPHVLEYFGRTQLDRFIRTEMEFFGRTGLDRFGN